MISKQDIIKMAREVFHRSRRRRRRQLMNPVREWFIGLSVFLVVATGGSLWVWSEYTFYKNLQPENGEIGIELVDYREGAAEAAVARFSERKQAFNALVSAPPLAELPLPSDEGATSTSIVTDAVSPQAAGEEAGTTTIQTPGTTTILID